MEFRHGPKVILDLKIDVDDVMALRKSDVFRYKTVSSFKPWLHRSL